MFKDLTSFHMAIQYHCIRCGGEMDRRNPVAGAIAKKTCEFTKSVYAHLQSVVNWYCVFSLKYCLNIMNGTLKEDFGGIQMGTLVDIDIHGNEVSVCIKDSKTTITFFYVWDTNVDRRVPEYVLRSSVNGVGDVYHVNILTQREIEEGIANGTIH